MFKYITEYQLPAETQSWRTPHAASGGVEERGRQGMLFVLKFLFLPGVQKSIVLLHVCCRNREEIRKNTDERTVAPLSRQQNIEKQMIG